MYQHIIYLTLNPKSLGKRLWCEAQPGVSRKTYSTTELGTHVANDIANRRINPLQYLRF